MDERYSNVLLTDEEIEKIKKKSPINMPINPAEAGWTGAQIRIWLAKYVIDSDDSVLSKLKEKLLAIKGNFESSDAYEEYNSTEDFPVQGYVDRLYLAKKFPNPLFGDAGEPEFIPYNMLFRWDDEENMFIPIAGSGSGGGTSGGVLEIVRLRPLTSLTTYAGLDQDTIIQFEYASSISEAVVFTYYKNGVVVKTEGEKTVGVHEWNVKNLIDVGRSEFKIELQTPSGTTTSVTFAVIGVQVNIGSPFIDTLYYEEENILFVYSLSTDDTVTERYAMFSIDGGVWEEIPITQINNLKIFSYATYGHGSFKLDYKGKVVIEGDEIFSNTLSYTMNFVDTTSTDIILSSKFNKTEITQGDPLVIDYQVYNPLSLSQQVELYVDDVLVSQVTADRTRRYWNVNNIEAGTRELKIVADTEQIIFTLNVIAFDIDFETLKIDDQFLETFLDASDKTNQDLDRDTWENSGANGITYPFTMTDFNFTSNGWIDGGLVFTGLAKAELDFQPFATEPTYAGRTIEIEFETNEAIDTNQYVIQCFAKDRGFYVKPNEIMLKSSNTLSRMYFKEQDRIKLSFVFDKLNNRVYTYINGVLTRFQDVSNETLWSQEELATNIKFNENLTGMKLFNFRYYERSLDDKEILNNYIYDRQTIVDKVANYNGSLIYDDNGKVDIDKASEKIPCLIITLNNRDLPEAEDDEPYAEQIEMIDPFIPERNYTRQNVRVNPQGSSSLQYPIKNYRLSKGGVKDDPIPVDPESIHSKKVNLKADYMESSMSTDPAISNIAERMYDKKTPPQEEYDGVRTSTAGYPILLFHRNNGVLTFRGVYNYNDSKSDEDVFGHDIGLGPSWRYEVLFNAVDHAVSFVKDPAITRDQWLDQIYQGWEARYPKDPLEYPDNTNIEYYAPLIEATEFVADYQPLPTGLYANLSESDKQIINDFKNGLEKRFEIEYLIKYLLTVFTFGLIDNLGKDLLLNAWLQDVSGGTLPDLQDNFLPFKGIIDTTAELPTEGMLIGHAYLVSGQAYVFTGSDVSTVINDVTYPSVNGWQNFGYTKFYVTLYDMDTAIGIDNFSRYVDENGDLRYDYNIELDDGSAIYAQASSKLWDYLIIAYPTEMQETYQAMRNGPFSWDTIHTWFFENQINKISKAMYNENAKTKYLSTPSWYWMLKGDRASQIKRWMTNRLAFLDSKYIAGTGNYKISMRFNVESTETLALNLTPTIHQWVTVKYGNIDIPAQTRALAGQEVTVTSPIENSALPFFEVTVFGANYIASISNLTEFDLVELNLEGAERLQHLDLHREVGDPIPLDNLTFAYNPNLETVDIRGITTLTDLLDCSQLSKLKSLDATGSAIQGVIVPQGGVLQTLKLPATITFFTLLGQKYLDNSGLVLEGVSNIQTLRIETSPKINAFDILDNATSVQYVRIIDAEITTFGLTNLVTVAEILYDFINNVFLVQGLDENGNVVANPQISATIKVLTDGVELQSDIDKINTALPFIDLFLYSNIENLSVAFNGDVLEITGYTGTLEELYLPDYEYSNVNSGQPYLLGLDQWALISKINSGTFTTLSSTDFIYIPEEITDVEIGAFTTIGTTRLFVQHDTKPVGWDDAWHDGNNGGVFFGVPDTKSTFEFNVAGGDEIASVIDHVIELPTPTKYGYEFDGWTLNGQPVSGTHYIPDTAGVHTLVATWTPWIYTVNYLNSDLTVFATQQVTFGDAVGTFFDNLGEPISDAGIFLEWQYVEQAIDNTFVPDQDKNVDGLTVNITSLFADVRGLSATYYNDDAVNYANGYYVVDSFDNTGLADYDTQKLYIPAFWDDGVNGNHPVKSIDINTPILNVGVSPLEVTIQDGVKEVLEYGLNNFRHTKKVTIPQSIEFMDDRALADIGTFLKNSDEYCEVNFYNDFSNYTSKYITSNAVVKINIFSNITEIPTYFFYATDEYHGFTLPSTLTTIRSRALGFAVQDQGTQNLDFLSQAGTLTVEAGAFQGWIIIDNNITIPNNVVEFDGANFFRWYDNVDTVNIGPNTNISGNIGGSAYLKFIVDLANPYISHHSDGYILYDKVLEKTKYFYIHQTKDNYIIDDNIKEIANATIADDRTIKGNLHFGSSVTAFHVSAMILNAGFSTFTMSATNTTFVENNGCIYRISNNNITIVNKNAVFSTIIQGVTEIEQGAFGYYNPTVKAIEIPNTITNIQLYAFQYANITNLTFEIGISLQSIPSYTFRGTELQTVVLPDGLERIYDGAFQLTKLTVIPTIPTSIISISKSVFRDITTLTTRSYTVESHWGYIDSYIFMDTNMNQVTIEEGITSIGDYSFVGTNISSVTIPSTVTSIGRDCFDNIEELAEVIMLPTTPPTLGDADVFDYTGTGTRVIKVPVGTLSAYQNAPFWSEWSADMIENV